MGYRRKKNDRLLMFTLRMNQRAADGRRLGAAYFDREPEGAGGAAPLPGSRQSTTLTGSLTHPLASNAERHDDNAAQITGFSPVPLDPRQQAEFYEALAAQARARADRLPEDDPEVPFVALSDASHHFIGAFEGRPTHSHDFIPYDLDERPWNLLHDEDGARAIDEAVAQVKAARAAGYFDQPSPARGEGGDPPRSGGEDEGDASPAEQLSAPAPADPDARLSPKTRRPYKKRTPKPPFEDTFDHRNSET